MSGSPDAARGPLHPKPAGTDTNARPKFGDRVKVTVEGDVQSLVLGGTFAYIGDEYTSVQTPLTSGVGRTVTVEVLPPPEPEWQDGDVAIDRLGIAHLRAADDIPGRPWRTFNGQYHDETFPLRPLTLAVRDGKPVK